MRKGMLIGLWAGLGLLLPAGAVRGQATGFRPDNAVPLYLRPTDGSPVAELGGLPVFLGLRQDELARHLEACTSSGSSRCGESRIAREHPGRTEWVERFVMDRFEIVRAQYDRCVAAGACPAVDEAACRVFDPSAGDWATGRALPEAALHPEAPRTCVTLAEAESYCRWVGGRLPSEAEWELAAGGGHNLIYPWGNTFDASRVSYLGHGQHLAPAWSFPGGGSPAGIYHLAGNAYEWTGGPACDYRAEACENAGEGVIRGGSFASDGGGVRTTYRRYLARDARNDDVGFRCVVPESYLRQVELGTRLDVSTALELPSLQGPRAATGSPLDMSSEHSPSRSNGLTIARVEGASWLLGAFGSATPCHTAPPEPSHRLFRFGYDADVMLEVDAAGAWWWAVDPARDCVVRWPAPPVPEPEPRRPASAADIGHPRVLGMLDTDVVLTDLETGEVFTVYRHPIPLKSAAWDARGFIVLTDDDWGHFYVDASAGAATTATALVVPALESHYVEEGEYEEERATPVVQTDDGPCLPIYYDDGAYGDYAGGLAYDAAVGGLVRGGCERAWDVREMGACTTPEFARAFQELPAEAPFDVRLQLDDPSRALPVRTGYSDDTRVLESCVGERVLFELSSWGTSGTTSEFWVANEHLELVETLPAFSGDRPSPFYGYESGFWTVDRRFLIWGAGGWPLRWTVHDLEGPPRLVSETDVDSYPVYFPAGTPFLPPAGPPPSEGSGTP